MKLRIILISVICFTLSACNSVTTTNPSPMFSGTPNINLLDPSIADSTLVANAPDTKMHIMRYRAYSLPDLAFYSNYQITRDRTDNKYTQYHTIENTIHHGSVVGHGLGYGGMFSIIYLKTGNIPNSPEFYKKYRWTNVSNVQGHLFPLHKGNTVRFNYHEQVRYKPTRNNLSEQENNGTIFYEIIGEQDGYRNGKLYVPGKVYIVRFSKSTNASGMEWQNEYYFSEYLGWYIQATYYFNNQAKVVYKLVGYS
ncbi:MAG: hypothetical protein AB7F64_09050 [Gammaproteobacteria bacterium]